MTLCVRTLSNVTLAQGRRQHLLDISEESYAIHGAVDHIGCGHAVDAERGDQGQRLPVPVRDPGDKALANWRAAVMTDHLRRYSRLVDENETRGLQLRLLGFEFCTGGRNIRSILLGGVQRFF